MQDVARLQAESGHEVAFFGMAHVENDPSEYSDSFPSQVDFDPVPSSLVGKLRGVGRMFWSTSAARGIGVVLDDFRPDVVHLHNIYHQLSPSILRSIARRQVPMVMTLHDYSLACPTYNFMSHGEVCEACVGGHFMETVRRRCQGGSLGASLVAAADLAVHTRLDSYGSINLLVCPSEFMVEKMTESQVHPDRLRRLNHFVHLDQPVKSTPGQGVLFVGRLSPEKGVDVLVRAAAGLPSGTTVDIVGDGPERARLTELAAELAPGVVRFHGRLQADAVAERLRAAAICVIPSRWYENQPLVVLEAYTAGTPVVGARLGGITELIEPGTTGELFRAGSWSDLTGVLTRLLDDPEHCARMGRAGRAWVESNFSPEAHLTQLHAIYDEAAGHAASNGVGPRVSGTRAPRAAPATSR